MPATEFLNVDLDVYSKHDLQPLINRLGRKVDVLFVGKERGKFSTHLEVARRTRTPDATIRAFCALIESLPKAERAIWDSASIRSFSIGIQAGAHPNPRDFTIRPETVRAVSAIGAQIVLTIYPEAATTRG